MKSGSLRHWVTLQSPGGSKDSVGERTTVWADVFSCWANVSPVSTSERHVAGQAHSDISHRVTLRWATELSALHASWRVLFGERILTIEGIRNIDERDRVIELVCTEGIRTK